MLAAGAGVRGRGAYALCAFGIGKRMSPGSRLARLGRQTARPNWASSPWRLFWVVEGRKSPGGKFDGGKVAAVSLSYGPKWGRPWHHVPCLALVCEEHLSTRISGGFTRILALIGLSAIWQKIVIPENGNEYGKMRESQQFTISGYIYLSFNQQPFEDFPPVSHLLEKSHWHEI